MKKPKSSGAQRAVIVTTSYRGVFYGLASDTSGETIVLDKPRMCVYWSADVKGILGLAATGPTASCRITLAPPRIALRGITSVIECSPQAVAAWESGPWAK